MDSPAKIFYNSAIEFYDPGCESLFFVDLIIIKKKYLKLF